QGEIEGERDRQSGRGRGKEREGEKERGKERPLKSHFSSGNPLRHFYLLCVFCGNHIFQICPPCLYTSETPNTVILPIPPHYLQYPKRKPCKNQKKKKP